MKCSKSNQVYILEILYSYIKQSGKPLKISVVSDLYKELQEDWKAILSADKCVFDFSRDESEYYLNQSTIEFFDTTNSVKLFAPKRDILFSINIEWEYYRELMIRTTGAIITL